jgi:hypothetical protein
VTFQLALFLHVLSMLGVFAALTLEWVSVLSMRRARSFEQARDANGLQRWVMPIGMASTLVILATGVYLARILSLWGLVWVKLAVPMLVVVAIAGAVANPQRKRIRAAVASGTGTLPNPLTTSLVVGSLWTRSALLVALVYAMTVKP